MRKVERQSDLGQNHAAGCFAPKVVTPSVRCEVADHLQKAYGVSEQEGVPSQRLPSIDAALSQPLRSADRVAYAAQRARWRAFAMSNKIFDKRASEAAECANRGKESTAKATLPTLRKTEPLRTG